jgi:hypothetical protein
MTRRPLTFAAAVVLSAGWLAASPVFAWNSAGHMIVALVAYEQMNEATRAKAVELIRSHPRFEPHFQRMMPRDVARGKEAEQNAWLFAHASTWPDLVRDSRGTVDRSDVTRFNRPYWHYINHPVFLNEAERRQLEPGLRLYVSREPPPERDEASMNIVQAVKNSTRILQDPQATPQDRAVHLCWLLHLAGDSHQPLHAAALYTAARFRRGDEGGNQLEIEHNWKLHGFWDDQISTDNSFESIRILAAAMEKDPKLAAIGQQAAGTADVEKWIDESRELATRFAYSEEVLKLIAARETHPHLGPLNLSAEYRANAETVAERRAMQAGYRLAALLQQLLK